MFEQLRRFLLPLLRVPPTPEPPLGAPNSVHVFRAGRNYYKLKIILWSVGQIAPLVGIILSLSFLARVKNDADLIREERSAARARQNAAVQTIPANATTAPETPPAAVAAPAKEQSRALDPFWHDPNNPVGRLIDRSPWWLFPLITALELFGILAYLVQLPVTFALLRLEFEVHWYIVTDRSLRIRWGLLTMREATMSFANVQQVTVSQNPIQRLLGIADVRVQSAGGGNGGDSEKPGDDAMHSGVFHGVENAETIRDLILDRLRRFRAAGLGDPEDHSDELPAQGGSHSSPTEVRTAALAALSEARALRASLT